MEQTRTLIQHIASLVVARANCAKTGNNEWFNHHSEMLEILANEFLPSGSGIDCGTKIDLDASNGTKIVLLTSFHHMNDGGMYDGWTEHKIVVTPAFEDFYLAIGGRNRNDIKDYLSDTFSSALSQELIHNEDGYRLAA